MKTRNAFTLVELIIVLTIISLLAGIIIAAAGPARERARQSVCVSNLHQLHLAMTSYRQDYDGADPLEGSKWTCGQIGVPCSAESYDVYLKDYVRNREILLCPSFVSLRGQKPQSNYSITRLSPNNPAIGVEQAAFTRLGMRTPMFSCEDHNPPIDYKTAPRWATHRTLLVRYDGQVVTKILPIWEAFFPYESLQ